MTSDFTNRMISMIKEAVAERARAESGGSLVQEITNHTSFCKAKLENFHGREKAQEVSSFVLNASITFIHSFMIH